MEENNKVGSLASLRKPKKGILKSSSSFDTKESNAKKSKETKWDEMNIIATLHPPDKDYGHMKIEEPKTPFNYVDVENLDVVDAKELSEKLKEKGNLLPKALEESESEEADSDEDLTPEERQKMREFKMKRKQHYNEFYAVKLARKLLEEEDDEEESETKPGASNIEENSNGSPQNSPNPGKNNEEDSN